MIYIFKTVPHSERSEYQNRVDNIKKEKDLKGDDIRNILIGEIKPLNLKYTMEKNIRGVNEHPFDLTLGREENLELYGYEIKGDTDNFSRLKGQLGAYLYAFHEVYLVLHKKKKPEWLPSYVGVIRVFENNEVWQEESCYIEDPFDISTDYEWDALFRCNSLGITSKRTREVLNLIGEIRRNIIFNRFFSIHSGFNTKKFEKFYPFTDKQKTILMGFDVPYHYKLLKKDVKQLEDRLDNIKMACMIGQKALKEFEG